MRFVDEFRDPEMARVLARQIARLVDPRRHYKFMEVCGGHTHTIYKHGIEDYLPPNKPGSGQRVAGRWSAGIRTDRQPRDHDHASARGTGYYG